MSFPALSLPSGLVRCVSISGSVNSLASVREAFDLLANASAFLDLPAEDILNTPASDDAVQEAILKKAISQTRRIRDGR